VPSRLAKATLKGLGLDGLTEQSAKLSQQPGGI